MATVGRATALPCRPRWDSFQSSNRRASTKSFQVTFYGRVSQNYEPCSNSHSRKTVLQDRRSVRIDGRAGARASLLGIGIPYARAAEESRGAAHLSQARRGDGVED